MDKCPICGSASKHSFDSKFFKISQCTYKDCSHLFATDSLPFAGVHNFKDDDEVDYGIYEERNNALISYLKNKGFIKDGFSLLDFGAGTGHILFSIRKNTTNLKITAIEYNSDYHSKLNQFSDFVFRTVNEIPQNLEFDFVLMIEVIEHLDNPVGLLTEIKKHLNKNGRILIATPAGDLRRGVDSKEKLEAYHSPYHVQFFTEKSIKMCLERSGYKKLSYKYMNALYPNRPYEGLRALEYVLRGYLNHLKGYTHHLTFIAG